MRFTTMLLTVLFYTLLAGCAAATADNDAAGAANMPTPAAQSTAPVQTGTAMAKRGCEFEGKTFRPGSRKPSSVPGRTGADPDTPQFLPMVCTRQRTDGGYVYLWMADLNY